MDKLRVNKKFAARYEKKKAHEERSQLREKYGSEVSRSSGESSSSEEEDEDAEALTSDVERDFLRTLSLLKSKDPSIYDTQTIFFSHGSKGSAEAGEAESSGKSTLHRPVYLKDYERQRLIERGSMAGLSDSEEEEQEEREPTYQQEQEALKASFQAAVTEQDIDAEDLLVPRLKSEEDKAREEREYVQWLKGGGVELAETVAQDLAPLKEYWADPSLGEDERFLRDYILNKGYLERDVDRIPRYDEVVESDSEAPPPSDSEDEEALEEQEVFERKYNFRFEEPDAELITSYPRTLGGSVRREDDRRKVKRREREERRAREKEVRKEEIRRLRNLQEMEVKDKLEKLARVTGNPVDSFGLSAKDLEEDFDPSSYDETMRGVFNEDYYEDAGEEDEKPVFSDLEEELNEDCQPWMGKGCEHHELEFNMDADYEDWGEGEGEEGGVADPGELGHTRRKRRKKMNFDPAAAAEEKHELESRLKGELFRYREVEPNDFGLTTEEILCSDNKELNRWVSLSKAVQYLTPQEEQEAKKRFRKRARNWKKKSTVLTTYYSTAEGNPESSGDDGVNKGQPKGQPKGQVKAESGKSSAKKQKRLKAKGKSKKSKNVNLSEVRLKSYGL